MYTVFCVYYKHNKFSTDIYKDGDTLRKFCMSELEEYDGFVGDIDYEGIEDIDILIYKTIKYGTKFVSEQCGWGVVSIIKGDNLTQYDSDSKIEHKLM